MPEQAPPPLGSGQGGSGGDEHSGLDLGLARTNTWRRYRLGVMGGTFDPIHHGHLVAASEVAARFDLDEVVFVPTGVPWQKAGRRVSKGEDRYLMTVIATASNPQFTVSRVDIDRAGNTYTVDTLRDIRAERGGNLDLYFITGADALRSILTWRGADELFDLAHFVGVTRPGVNLHRSDLSHLPSDKVTLLEVPALAISSTECRTRVAAGLPLWYLVPDGVVQYVAKRGLYTEANESQILRPDPVPQGTVDARSERPAGSLQKEENR
ncbi:nicotinate-nucleotide adenylyltransferase [Propionibacterium cyclohexanicum]|uniref:Probable nicotinate-nucleotide adenylyltransferase n=1 Tax=Propionibacterium cyclohexanicum TaxID=64702 RepID=A0A1H9SAC0_9ACTN|nr:nicotinate-nucleotide adenylyltransferase [Propionibacterium cyclohexanicum]SER81960.1 nicotinate-nucleotide adenylyltransferase [Propionibacterium cyclohexanicum]